MRGTNTDEEKIRNINRVLTNETLPYWSIVSIDGFYLEECSWFNTKNTPVIYGLVKNPAGFDDKKTATLRDDQTYCTFVLSGEMEWVNESDANTLTCPVDTMDLALEQLSLKDLNIVDCEEVPDFIKWFDKSKYGNKFGWKIKYYENRRLECWRPLQFYFLIQCFLSIFRPPQLAVLVLLVKLTRRNLDQ